VNQLIAQQLQFVSDAGNRNFIVYFIALGSILYLYINGYKKEALLFIVAAVSSIFSTILKYIFRQPRPVTAHSNYVFDQYGFPSSHTLMYTAMFGFMLYLVFKLTFIPLPLRIIAVAVSFYFITLVGISRVYLGQHYIWDVVAGYIFGALYLIALIMLDKRL
jgi:undecaprenyl-diphosphatase